MIKNLKIGTRLGLGFVVMLMLMVAVGIFAMYQMSHLATLTTKLHDHPFVVSNAVRDVDSNVIAMHRSMKDVALAEDSASLEVAANVVEQHEKKVYNMFDIIQERFLGDQKDVEEVIQIFTAWKPIRDEVIDLMRQGKKSEAAAITKGKGQRHIDVLDKEIHDLVDFASQKADIFLENAHSEAYKANIGMIVLLIISVFAGIAIAFVTSRTIIHPLKTAVNIADQVSEGKLNVAFHVNSKDEVGQVLVAIKKMIRYIQEIAEIAEKVSNQNLQVEVNPKSGQDILNHSLNKMVVNLQRIQGENEKSMAEIEQQNNVMQRQNWLKDGVSQLSAELSGNRSLVDVCQKSVSFVAKYVNAGHGALYTYDKKKEVLKLKGTFAFTERNKLSNTYRLGEGVVGQVALEQSPILLKHLTRQEALITTGIVSKVPLNTYTFPLLYDNNLYGVLEVASSEPFDEYTQNFLNEVNQVIATVLFSTAQQEQVKELLEVSQQATREAEQAAKEAEQAKDEAQQKAQEVQHANIQLEEQQQKLQQQSEELQQVNDHLKEQQQQLQQQSEELQQQNENLNKTKEELDQRAKDLEMASKYKSEFLANMSHELRTPLNSIILLSKMLSRNEKQNLDEKDVKQVSVIHQAGEELLRLINDILDLSKIEAGKATVNITEFQIRELFDSFRDLFRSVADEKGLEFIIHDVDAILKTDRDKLSQVIRNLLSNAFKFTREGSVTLAALINPSQKDTVQITVSDTGIGIPKDKQKFVFEAFQQADGSTSREFGGTGLGLSIARGYVKLLGGTLSLESDPEQGTTFTMTLPVILKDVPSPTESVPSFAEPMPQPSKPFVAKSPLSATTEIIDDRDHLSSSDKIILIIEDNADLAQSTMDVTKEMGFKVLVALNGRDGLSLAAKYRPTGILLDLVLPDMNGMEILRELKSTRELRHIPVHIMSSKERDNSYRYSGAIGYFQKPVNDIDIRHAVESLMAVSEKYPKQLLIVEDDDTQREAIQELLGSSKEVRATGVSSRNEAITEIDKGEYDAAIIDLGLKESSGYEICRYIKEHNITLPVIIYTGRDLTEEEERELRQYTDSIIIKTAKSYERLSDEAALFLHQMYHGEAERLTTKPVPLKPLKNRGSLEGKKILIVDDDVKNVFVLASAIENHGAIVIDAKNGQVALEKIHQEEDIDLVLMDIMMPVMDGYTAIRQIRKDDKFKHLPIIALTAKALKGDRQKCIQAGADDYLSKPVDYDGLIRLAKAWIEKEG